MRGSDPTERKCLNLNGLPSTSIEKPLPRQRVIPATTGSSKINSRLIGGESEWGDEGEIVDKAPTYYRCEYRYQRPRRQDLKSYAAVDGCAKSTISPSSPHSDSPPIKRLLILLLPVVAGIT